MTEGIGGEEAIDAIWADDILSRRQDAEYLIEFLTKRIVERQERGLPRSFVLNVEAGWGFGKTFFLSHLQRHLDALGYLVAHINAWRDDHGDDPLVAVISSINKTADPIIRRRQDLQAAWNKAKHSGAHIVLAGVKGVAMHWARKAVGSDTVEDTLEQLDLSRGAVDAAGESAAKKVEELLDRETKALLENHEKAQRSIDAFRKGIEQFVALTVDDAKVNRKAPLFVLVDELDRCRPTYAIALLERVKHLFDINDVVFIVACNTAELRHSISAIYGSAFDSRGYLHRFFDRTYLFDDPDLFAFVNLMVSQYGLKPEKFSLPNGNDLVETIAAGFRAFGFGLRDAEQCFDLIRTIATGWRNQVPIEMLVLLPLAIGYHRGLNPALTPDYPKALNDLLSQQPHSSAAWTVAFPDYRRADVRRSNEKVLAISVFERFLEVRDTPLPRITEREVEGWPRWVQQRLGDEQHREWGSWDARNPPLSIIREYPNLVRTAGRFSTRSKATTDA